LGGCNAPLQKTLANPVASKENKMAHKDDQDNHADQLNPNNDAYWESRGWDDRPDDWEERSESGDTMPD